MTQIIRGRIVVQSYSFYLLHHDDMYYISDIDVRKNSLNYKLKSIREGLEATAEINQHFSEIVPGSLNIIE